MLWVVLYVVLVTSPFYCYSCFALLLLSYSSLPAFLICYSAALRHMGFFSACLRVLINSQSPRRSECTRQCILARRQANLRVSHLPQPPGIGRKISGASSTNAAAPA